MKRPELITLARYAVAKISCNEGKTLGNQQPAMITVSTCKTDRSYNYVVVHGVHTTPAVAAGMRVALSYCEATIEYAIDFVRINHPDIAIDSVINFTGA